jgi:hypothetical protein
MLENRRKDAKNALVTPPMQFRCSSVVVPL